MKIHAYAAKGQGTEFIPFEYDPGELGPDEVEIQVEACGICHSDLSVWKNEWGNAEYPFVGGHEIAGIVSAAGSQVRHVQEGQRVGLGWFARSCMGCEHCLAGDHNLCVERKDTIIGRYGGFADRVRCHWAWAIPLPGGIDIRTAGPLFCGGITVFSPIVLAGVQPTDRVGVIGIGRIARGTMRRNQAVSVVDLAGDAWIDWIRGGLEGVEAPGPLVQAWLDAARSSVRSEMVKLACSPSTPRTRGWCWWRVMKRRFSAMP